MARRYFRWWHGPILGALVAIGAWQLHATIADSKSIHVASGIYPGQFARLITPDPTRPGANHISDVIVHPAEEGKNLVTFRAKRDVDEPEQAMELNAAIPFKATIRDGLFPRAQTFDSVRGYLDAMKISYRYAWWESPTAAMWLWAGVPFGLLGIALPTIVGVLRLVGVMEKPPKRVKLPPAPKAKPAPAMSAEDRAAADSQMEAATADLEERLATTNGEATSSPIAASPTVETKPIVFQSGPDDAPVPIAEKEATTYEGGVYYPVHRSKREER